jgi:hypothetical protein
LESGDTSHEKRVASDRYSERGMMSDTQQKTHTLGEVAAMLRLESQVRDPIRWLSRRLNSRELRGVRVGRQWYMTDDHIRFLLKKYSNDHLVAEPEPPPEPVPPVLPVVGSIVDGLSAVSRRRLRGGGANGA